MTGNPLDLGREPVYKACEVAALLRVSVDTVYRLISGGELDVIKVGKRGYRIKKSVADAYLAGIGFTDAPTAATA